MTRMFPAALALALSTTSAAAPMQRGGDNFTDPGGPILIDVVCAADMFIRIDGIDGEIAPGAPFVEVQLMDGVEDAPDEIYSSDGTGRVEAVVVAELTPDHIFDILGTVSAVADDGAYASRVAEPERNPEPMVSVALVVDDRIVAESQVPPELVVEQADMLCAPWAG